MTLVPVCAPLSEVEIFFTPSSGSVAWSVTTTFPLFQPLLFGLGLALATVTGGVVSCGMTIVTSCGWLISLPSLDHGQRVTLLAGSQLCAVRQRDLARVAIDLKFIRSAASCDLPIAQGVGISIGRG